MNEAFRTIPPGGELTLLLYREPFPLYAVLERGGYVHSTQLERDGTYRIRIRPGR